MIFKIEIIRKIMIWIAFQNHHLKCNYQNQDKNHAQLCLSSAASFLNQLSKHRTLSDTQIIVSTNESKYVHNYSAINKLKFIQQR